MIHEVLLYGETNAITGQALAAMLQLKDAREVSRLAERERRAGIPICATTSISNPGYYLADSAEEFEAYIRSLDRRLRNIRKTREACQDTLLRMTGQQYMDGGEV